MPVVDSRPITGAVGFDDVIGHREIVDFLRAEMGAAGHAYLFTGAGSVGKATVAREFARLLLVPRWWRPRGALPILSPSGFWQSSRPDRRGAGGPDQPRSRSGEGSRFAGCSLAGGVADGGCSSSRMQG